MTHTGAAGLVKAPGRHGATPVTGREPAERDEATAAACVLAYERGAQVFRVHAVRTTRDALRVAQATRDA